MSETIVVEGATILTMDGNRRVLRDGSVAVEGSYIVDVGKKDEVRARNKVDLRLDGSGKLVMPGLIDCHQHTTQMLARGMADDVDLEPWIYDRILPYEAALTSEDVLTSSMLCCVEMIRNGTTCFADPGGYHMDRVAEAMSKSGIRGTICYGSMDQDINGVILPKEISGGADECVRQTERLFETYNNAAEGRVRVSGCLRADALVSPELATKINEFALKHHLVVQMHTANSKKRVEDFERRYGKGVFEFFDSLGLLGPHWLLGHVAVLRNEQVPIVVKRGVNTCHIPGSSLHGAYGASVYGKYPELVRAGANVCLGCDASAANNSLDMFIAMRQAATLHKEARASAAFITPEQAMEMATINGAKSLMESRIGSLEKGKLADLIIVGLRKPNSTPIHDFSLVPTLVYSVTGADVETVIINGKIVMEQRKILNLDEGELVAKAQAAGENIVDRVGLELRPKWPMF
jgi:5-methylthioadenosine/S-adenosylhomocysteine deaminase